METSERKLHCEIWRKDGIGGGGQEKGEAGRERAWVKAKDPGRGRHP